MSEQPKLRNRFKADDRVRCIDDQQIIMLGNGEEYDVIGVDLDENEFNIGSEFDFVFIDFGVEELNQNRLRASRFELVVPEYDPLVGEE